jgi:hypothetical protein
MCIVGRQCESSFLRAISNALYDCTTNIQTNLQKKFMLNFERNNLFFKIVVLVFFFN